MFDFPLPIAVLVFVVSAAVIWVAGVKLVDATDAIDQRFGLGQALGGAILLAIVTNLPEVAITVSASLAGNLDVIVGNILGGIAIQTVLLAVFDLAAREKRPLSTLAGNKANLVQANFVVMILATCVMSTQLDPDRSAGHLSPGPIMLLLLWLACLVLIARTERESPRTATTAPAPEREQGTKRPMLVFALAAIATLVAGVILERSGDAIADELGMDGVLFGATFLAAATALPELSTGLRAIARRRYAMAVSDIIGGNAFLPVLFLLAALISGQAALPGAEPADIYLAALAMVLTAVVTIGAVLKPQNKRFGVGADSLALVGFYALGMVGLTLVATP
ncbi:sodium:calcium antiporter [Devosia sediminis]|uniref:Sodium/calcium exchanger membrane region domain-containing protein n=1 Tax=Devosia sediminis TaxID=2798801 RepID=A0A934MKU7_9HYPH|nr:hypothetical protein [Devosia sediminis]MBJ3783961.1 hypothetical protein [Devosia sediminis]